jgi:2-C-methyl-D-erythritol 4-phosphate cytidylyltransferase
MQLTRNAALLLAAGRGQRMETSVPDKILAPLAGRPVFQWSAEAFLRSGLFQRVVLVCRDEAQRAELARLWEACDPSPTTEVVLCLGGRERQDSVFLGLVEAGQDCDYVFIHDCARPLVRPSTLQALYQLVLEDKAAALAHPVTDTLQRAEHQAGRYRGCSVEPVSRDGLWAMETPQAFAYQAIFDAYQKARQEGRAATDDVSLAAADGRRVSLLPSPDPNPKITTPGDLALVELLARARAAETPAP